MLGKGGMQIFTFGRYNANINLSTFIAERYAASLYLNIFLVINGRFTIFPFPFIYYCDSISNKNGRLPLSLV